MLQIGDCQQQRIVEDRARKVERYSMLVEVRSSFLSIPCKPEFKPMQGIIFAQRLA